MLSNLERRRTLSTYDPNVGFLLHEVARLLKRRFEQRSRHLGLTRAQWQALFSLARNEGVHQGAMADLLDVEPITLMRILDKLEENGLIERRQHPSDRRIRLLFTTPAAHPVLEEMRKLGEITRTEALEGLPQADRDALLRSLTLMKCNLVAACTRPATIEIAADHG